MHQGKVGSLDESHRLKLSAMHAGDFNRRSVQSHSRADALHGAPRRR